MKIKTIEDFEYEIKDDAQVIGIVVSSAEGYEIILKPNQVRFLNY